jgi:hypothetical protein
MRCRCGKEFCYACGGVYRQCGCGNFQNLFHTFYIEERRMVLEDNLEVDVRRPYIMGRQDFRVP